MLGRGGESGRGGGGRGRHGGGPPPVVLPLASSHCPSRDFDRKLALPSTPSSSSQPPAPSQTPQLHVVMAPSSSKSDRPPARPGWGRAGRKCVIGANHFIGDVIVKDVHHYDVTITPEIPSKKVCRDTISELVTSYRESHLGKCSPAYYDGRKSLYTAGSLPFSSNDFVVKLVDKLDSKDRKELKYDVAIKFSGKADLHHYLQQFLGGMQLDAPQETLQVLDVILRSEPSTNYVVVGRSFFSPSLGETGILGNGLKYWKGFYQSLRPTQMGLSLDVDMSARAFCEPVLVSKFVEGCNIDQDRIKVENALKNVRVELVFRDGRQCKISGVSAKPLSPLIFSRDDLGKKTSVVQYYHKRNQINLSFLSLPALQVGWDAMPVCLPMELCKIVQGQSYSKKLNEKQVTALLRTTCQRPHDREQSINKGKEHLLVQEHVTDDRFLKDGHLFSSFGFTSKQNAWVGPDDWKYKKAKGLEDGSSPTIVEPRNKMSDVFAPPTNRAPCNATVPEDCNYQPEDHYDCLERRWNSSGMKKVVFATTSAWDILGLKVETQKQNVEKHTNIIIGIIDTGINPEAEGFLPDGIEPLDRPLIGSNDPNFTCNNKIVGARICYQPVRGDGEYSNTIRDYNGHGTNMAFAAAGNFVEACLGKLKKGTGRGGVPTARIAVYKICVGQNPSMRYSAIHRAAVLDKVDVLNISWGPTYDEEMVKDESLRYLSHTVGAGTFSGIMRGTLACVAAGNSCKYVTNISPWNLTVGACNSPTFFFTKVYLGSYKRHVWGFSINQFEGTAFCPLISFETAMINEIPATESSPHSPTRLDSQKVRGKIVVGPTDGDNIHDAIRTVKLAFEAGAVGSILIKHGHGNPKLTTFPQPGVWMSERIGKKIMKYLKSTSPVAKICTSTEFSNQHYPALAHFSPQRSNPLADFTKPDICAIGERVLLASHKKGKYRFVSGTSVATALVSGVVAFVKSIHPNWSPSAIKSAIMTTAQEMEVKTVADVERFGSGLISPLKAIDPGLIYDLTKMDYVLFMKGKGEEVRMSELYDVESMIPQGPEQSIQPQDFNYPSFRASLEGTNPEMVFQRKVKHVGLKAFSTYHAQFSKKSNLLDVDVSPSELSFDNDDQEKSFKVRVRVRKWNEDGLLAATLVWTNEKYTVQTPIIVVRRI